MSELVQTITLDTIKSGERVFELELFMRIYFSSYHLWSAKYFAKCAAEIEKSDPTGRFDGKHRAYTTGSIFSAVCFLEAAINEFCKDVVGGEPRTLTILPDSNRQPFLEFWSTERKLSILAKYQAVLRVLRKPELPKGKPPYQNAKLLIALRNELTHYKPATYGGKVQHSFMNKLAGKFAENPLMRQCKNPYFPDKCLGSPCAYWAVQSVQDLTDLFFKTLDYEPNYRKVNLEG